MRISGFSMCRALADAGWQCTARYAYGYSQSRLAKGRLMFRRRRRGLSSAMPPARHFSAQLRRAQRLSPLDTKRARAPMRARFDSAFTMRLIFAASAISFTSRERPNIGFGERRRGTAWGDEPPVSGARQEIRMPGSLPRHAHAEIVIARGRIFSAHDARCLFRYPRFARRFWRMQMMICRASLITRRLTALSGGALPVMRVRIERSLL